MDDTGALAGLRILVIEDDFLIASDLAEMLTDQGAEIIGPVGRVAQAVRLARTTDRIDGALLDINLRGETSFPVADVLHERGIRFVFTTGYDKASIPERYSDVGCCEKPLRIDRFRKLLFG
jgi:DNA-binding NarL/FixJ family response regulator